MIARPTAARAWPQIVPIVNTTTRHKVHRTRLVVMLSA